MIPVNSPLFAKNAKKYVLDCLESGWVSSSGKYIEKFESSFAKFIGSKYAVTVTNGTSALQLAISGLGIGVGDEVIVPDLTIISCALAPIYLGAKPVFVDVEPQWGNIDSSKIEEKITKDTRAIMAVHLYGHPANMDPILRIAKKHKLFLIEDAAEAHGAEIQVQSSKFKVQSWKKVGSIGDVGCFSFYSNKLITTGEGGMVVTNERQFYQKMLSLRNLAHSPKKRFLHIELGYNFRMTNMQAALGVAQLEEVDKYLDKKKWLVEEYTKRLFDVPFLELPAKDEPSFKSVCWMYAVKVKQNSGMSRDYVREKLYNLGVETRDFFVPMHRQPILKKLGIVDSSKFPVSEDLSSRGFYLPSGLAITKSQVAAVCNAIKKL